jgi:hypothetical protein
MAVRYFGKNFGKGITVLTDILKCRLLAADDWVAHIGPLEANIAWRDKPVETVRKKRPVMKAKKRSA